MPRRSLAHEIRNLAQIYMIWDKLRDNIDTDEMDKAMYDMVKAKIDHILSTLGTRDE